MPSTPLGSHQGQTGQRAWHSACPWVRYRQWPPLLLFTPQTLSIQFTSFCYRQWREWGGGGGGGQEATAPTDVTCLHTPVQPHSSAGSTELPVCDSQQ